jgi:hypothetical protein
MKYITNIEMRFVGYLRIMVQAGCTETSAGANQSCVTSRRVKISTQAVHKVYKG